MDLYHIYNYSMTFQQNIILPVLTLLSLFFSSQLWAQTDCSQQAIGYYLEKGFTPEQISRMCQAVPQSDKATISQQPPATGIDNQKPSVIANEQSSAAENDNDDYSFFNRTILSDSLTVTPQTLSYTRDQCIRYGEEDEYTSFRPKVCAIIKTTINRVGLKVLSAVKRISIFRDPELIVKGEIKREVVNYDSLPAKVQKTLDEIFDPAPETFDIITREDADAKQIAARLPR